MRLESLIAYFETSPSVRLLRSPNAPYIIDFLYRQFKDPGRLTIPMSDLVVGLRDYQDELHCQYPNFLCDKPEQYVSAWCAGDNRWLHRLLEANRNEPVYQLTPHTEDVLLFLDRALQKDLGFVGTESRLRLVISTLDDLVAGASDDPEVHLRYLRDERARIDGEISRIEQDGVGIRYEPAAIRERFAMAVMLLKQLLADFRAVEDRFREITKDVQWRQIHGQETRGSILEHALDSEDLLKKEDQGVSFYQFVEFILSPVRQEKLQGIIRELGKLEAIVQQTDGLTTVRRMVPLLLEEAEKVMRTNQRLSATLRRLLDSRSAADRQRLAQLLTEIRSLAAARAELPPDESIGVEVDTGISFGLPLSRSLWSPPPTFAPIDLTEHAVDDDKRMEAFRVLASMHRLDWQSMRRNIASMVGKHGTATIGQIIDSHPPRAGVVELLAYLQVARDDEHLISRQSTEQVRVRTRDPLRRDLQITIPLVHFVAPQGGVHA